ncbi:MAG TPA: glycosyltransferase family 2 protein [Terriglobia bacterium]|nr:glycosyltransferase family 2 protein [Terriglobia bacterium]
METVFWLSFIFIVYVYFGYPALLGMLRMLAGRPVRKAYYEPTVSIVIAAHNERERIEKKLLNCLALDYPKRKLQIIIGLDGPTDGTEFVVWKYAKQGIEMSHSHEHHGKSSTLNRAMRRATGEIVVFADVRQTFDPAAIRELTANFADPQVGAASGELILMDESRGEAKSDVGLYWRYEKALRAMESRIHSVAGATGAIYAIRRELYQELPEETLIDDVMIPMRVVLAGKRTIFDPQAKAYDAVACCPLAEYGRKVRTLAGNYQLLTQLPQLLLPWRNPIFVQFISHKVGRLLVPYALITLLISNAFILHGIYALFFSLQSAWYIFATAGYVFSKRDVTAPVLIADESRRAA